MAGSGAKERLSRGTLVCGEIFGGAGISAELIETGAFFEERCGLRRISVQPRAADRSSRQCGNRA